MSDSRKQNSDYLDRQMFLKHRYKVAQTKLDNLRQIVTEAQNTIDKTSTETQDLIARIHQIDEQMTVETINWTRS